MCAIYPNLLHKCFLSVKISSKLYECHGTVHVVTKRGREEKEKRGDHKVAVGDR